MGKFAELEDQMCSYTPDSSDSPDRMDALVWALTELMATPRKFLWMSDNMIKFHSRPVEKPWEVDRNWRWGD